MTAAVRAEHFLHAASDAIKEAALCACVQPARSLAPAQPCRPDGAGLAPSPYFLLFHSSTHPPSDARQAGLAVPAAVLERPRTRLRAEFAPESG